MSIEESFIRRDASERALALVESPQQSESIAPLDTREAAGVTADVKRSVSRDQRTNRTVLTLKKCAVIERASQRIIESAIPVTIGSRRIGAASQQQFNDGRISVTGGHHQRGDLSLHRPRFRFVIACPVDVRARIEKRLHRADLISMNRMHD